MPANRGTWYRILASAMLLCVLLCARQATADLSIVSDGQARAVILIPDDPSAIACEAADELARVIEKASGARLLIYPESEFWNRHPRWPADFATRLVVGNCQIVNQNGIDLSGLPTDLAGQQVELYFGAADEVAHVWVNGAFAGAHDIGPEGWDKRFNIDITGPAIPGQKNLIVVRVIDSDRMGGLWKAVKVVTPKTTLIPITDAWLRSNFPDAAYGKDPSLAVGANDYFRSVLIWQLPENLHKVTIRSAQLVLPLRYHMGSGSYSVYALAQDFYEPKVSWNTTDGATAWPGGAGAAGALAGAAVAQINLEAISAEQAEAADPPPALTFDPTELLRSWAGQEPPHGLLLVQDPPQEGVTLCPHSREADKPALRPRLEFEYAPAQ